MKCVRAERELENTWIKLILVLTSLRGNSFAWLSLHQLFLSHERFFLVDSLQRSWLNHATAGGLGLLLELGRQSQAAACFCLLPWFKQRGILTGLSLSCEVSYDERRLPCEHPDSVTQNACALPLHWEIIHILSSHSLFNQLLLFCASLPGKMNGSH